MSYNNKATAVAATAEGMPQNWKAEKAVLGALAGDTGKLFEYGLTDEDFYNPKHRIVFRAMRNLAGRQERVSPADLIEAIKSVKDIKVAGGEDYVAEICAEVHGEDWVSNGVRMLKDNTARRNAIVFGRRLAAAAEENITSEELIGLLNAGVGSVFKESMQDAIPAGERAYDDFMARMKLFQESEGMIEAVRFGIDPLDRLIDGQLTPKSTYIVLGATPSTGKTAFSCQAFYELLKQGYKVFFVSQEMKAAELIDRIVANVSGFSLTAINRGRFMGKDAEKVARIYREVKELVDANCEVCDDSSITVERIRAKAMAFKRRHGSLAAIFVDFIQRIGIDALKSAQAVQKLEGVSLGLKGIGKDLDCIMFVLSQLTLPDSTQKPELEHLKGAKAIGEDADIVILLQKTEDKIKELGHSIITINIAKGRSIGTGEATAKFTPKLMRFEDLNTWVHDESAPSPFEALGEPA